MIVITLHAVLVRARRCAGLEAGVPRHTNGDDAALRVVCLCFCQDINHCHTPLLFCLPRSVTDPPAPAESHFYPHSNQSQQSTKRSSPAEAAGHKETRL